MPSRNEGVTGDAMRMYRSAISTNPEVRKRTLEKKGEAFKAFFQKPEVTFGDGDLTLVSTLFAVARMEFAKTPSLHKPGSTEENAGEKGQSDQGDFP